MVVVVIVEKLVVVVGDFGMAHFVDVGDVGIGGYCWYDEEEIEFCDDDVDGFEEDVRRGLILRRVENASKETKPQPTKINNGRLKLTSHALAWWNSQLKMTRDEEVTWNEFKNLLRQEYYPMGYSQDRWSRWHNLRQQQHGQSAQKYTTEFRRLAVMLGISTTYEDLFTKYVPDLQWKIQNELQMYTLEDISSASDKSYRYGHRTSSAYEAKKEKELAYTECKEFLMIDLDSLPEPKASIIRKKHEKIMAKYNQE
nr:hypothetical protein [Tanacetum cinerariifolium]